MTQLLAKALEVVVEGLKLVNTDKARKYIDRVSEIQLDIVREESKGYESDDAKIERLYKELPIVLEAAKSEIALLQARANN